MKAVQDARMRNVLANSVSRRTFAGLGGGLLATFLAAILPGDVDARRKRKKKRGGGGGGGGGGGNDPGPGVLDAQESALLTLINDYRTANGARALVSNAYLDVAAKEHSRDMASRNYFDHNSPEGTTPQQRAERAGYRGFVSENIYAGGELATAVFDAWKASPPHNANLLDPQSEAVGLGRAFNANSEYEWYWTAVFGIPDFR